MVHRNQKSTINNQRIKFSLLAIFSLLFIFFVTLYPFDFTFPEASYGNYILQNGFRSPSSLGDCLRNIILFIPLSFALAYLLPKTNYCKILTFLFVLIFSSSLSLTIETLQIFISSRSSSSADLITNSLGGCLGYYIFINRQQVKKNIIKVVAKSNQYLSPRNLAIAFISYFLFICLISITLQTGTKLSNWDKNYHLLIGNETTQDRAWQGKISQLEVASRAISSEEVKKIFTQTHLASIPQNNLIADYQFIGTDNYRDRTGNLPNLTWQKKFTRINKETGISLDQNHWLTTTNPPTTLTKSIKEASQFTINTIISSAKIKQAGPARIISFSQGAFKRNFTLGQEGKMLVFRLRSVTTGKNGKLPEVVIPNVFTDNSWHHLIITYDGSQLNFYLDQVERMYSLVFNPDFTFFPHLLCLQTWRINLENPNLITHRLIFYVISFVPLGLFLGLLWQKLIIRVASKTLILIIIITLTCLLLEVVIAAIAHQEIRLVNIMVSLFFTTIAIILIEQLKIQYRQLIKSVDI